jgi:hypothetical protein
MINKIKIGDLLMGKILDINENIKNKNTSVLCKTLK